jgi:hypothetical protein
MGTTFMGTTFMGTTFMGTTFMGTTVGVGVRRVGVSGEACAACASDGRLRPSQGDGAHASGPLPVRGDGARRVEREGGREREREREG